MSNPTHKQRRSRTFRVEVLESRQLLSTAGIVSHPPAVVPLERVAHFSRTVEDVKYKGTFTGTGGFEMNSDTLISFTTTGTVENGGMQFPGPSTFSGTMVRVEEKAKIKYVHGDATLTDNMTHSRINIEFSSDLAKGKFKLEGKVIGGTGGTVTPKGGKFSAELSIGTEFVFSKLNIETK
jgi:hypothetical protein